MPMKTLLRALALCAALLILPAAALPEAPDAYMARLAIQSQKSECFAEVVYAGSTLNARGCGPVSVSNAVIGCLGVQDEALAVEMVRELTRLLVPRARRGKAYLNLSLLGDAVTREARLAQAEAFPAMAAVMSDFGGETCVYPGEIDQERLLAAAVSGERAIFVGQTAVQENWAYIVSLVRALHEAGRDDVMIYLARCDAGKKRHTTPLRSGDSGHYLSLCLPVGAFWNEGALYVLDSLPRAIGGEEASSESVYHVRYPFVTGSTVNDIRFREVFTAARVSTTVIRLSLTPQALGALEEALAAGADETQALHVQQLSPLVLFGSCSMLINTQGAR